ncbi:hypothetical protein PoB_002783400 [Plakobranchus ocellatus]|uniref:Uncharacterized protein n=1 Tax=Plakobranchus ocellatus TaxID=259542 RepID=A0AAV4A3Z8_9GAST|nr:hypothetical protein PoB_002783400 [Plakobranchus ocellatus]
MYAVLEYDSWKIILQTDESSPQQDDPRLSGPPSGQGAGGGAQIRDKTVPADLRADSLATVPPTPSAHLHSKIEMHKIESVDPNSKSKICVLDDRKTEPICRG